MNRNPLDKILEAFKSQSGQPANDWDEYITHANAKDIVRLNLGGLHFMTESEILEDMRAASECFDAYGNHTLAQHQKLQNILAKYRYSVRAIKESKDGKS